MQQHSNNDLYKLKERGIQSRKIEILQNNGINSIFGVINNTIKNIKLFKGMTEDCANKIFSISYEIFKQSSPVITGKQIRLYQKDTIKITTGSANIDTILGGGIHIGSVTEIFGANNTGKTQICHQLAVTVQFPVAWGGAEGCCVWIDTQGTFSSERVIQIGNRYGLDINTILDNILFVRSYSSDQQFKDLYAVPDLMKLYQCKLLIIDCATSLFRSEYVGRANLSDRQDNLKKYLRELSRLCNVYGIGVVITNQVVNDPIKTRGTSNMKPVGGNIIAHFSNARLALRQGDKNTHIAQMYHSSQLEEEECIFAISEDGVEDK